MLISPEDRAAYRKLGMLERVAQYAWAEAQHEREMQRKRAELARLQRQYLLSLKYFFIPLGVVIELWLLLRALR